MAEYADRERFIPVGKADLVDRLAHSRMVPPHSRETFLLFAKILDSIFHFEFHEQTESLKESYRPFNPDSDTVVTRRFTRKNEKPMKAVSWCLLKRC
jgi:hypothetical protein